MAGTSGLVSPSVDVGARPVAHPAALPFRTELSLAPLVRFWTQLSAYSGLGRGPLPGIVREKIKQAPELSAVIDDVSVIGKHPQLVDLMMSAMFPPAFWQQEYGAALFPFQLRAFYATSLFRRTLMNDDGTFRGRVNVEEQRLRAAKLLLAYELILERTYGIDLGVEIPVVFTSEDPATAPAPGPGRAGGRPRARAERRDEPRSRQHLRGLGAPQDVRVHGVAVRARSHPEPARHHR